MWDLGVAGLTGCMGRVGHEGRVRRLGTGAEGEGQSQGWRAAGSAWAGRAWAGPGGAGLGRARRG